MRATPELRLDERGDRRTEAPDLTLADNSSERLIRHAVRPVIPLPLPPPQEVLLPPRMHDGVSGKGKQRTAECGERKERPLTTLLGR